MKKSAREQLLLATSRGGRPSRLTAIDFDGKVVRIAQASGRGRRPKLSRVATAEIPHDVDAKDPQACGKWLGRTLRELKVQTGKGVVMGVPRGQVMLKPLTLPMPDDPRELAGMVHFQIGKDLPFDPEDAVVDFTVNRCNEPAANSDAAEGESDEAAGATADVLVAITRRAVVDEYRQLAEAADLKLAGLGLRSYGNVRGVEACGLDDSEQAIALISLRPDEVIIDILVESRLAFSRMAAANLHGHHHDKAAQEAGRALEQKQADAANPSYEASEENADAEADDVVDLAGKTSDRALISGVTTEVIRSLHGYRAHPDHRDVGRVVVSGDTGCEEAVAAALGERLGLPCQRLDPAAELRYRGSGSDQASAAIGAIGLAIAATEKQGLPFDFLNPKRPAVKRDTRPLKIAAAIGILVFIVGGMFYQRVTLVGEREQQLASLEEQIDEIDRFSTDMRRSILEERRIDEWLEGRRSWLNHYLYLSAVLPDSQNVYVSSFSTTSGGQIRLNLHARSGDVLIDVGRRLRDAGYNVRPLSVTPTSDSHGYNFRTTVQLGIPSDFELDQEQLDELDVPARPEDDIHRLRQSAHRHSPAHSPAQPLAHAEGGVAHE